MQAVHGFRHAQCTHVCTILCTVNHNLYQIITYPIFTSFKHAFSQLELLAEYFTIRFAVNLPTRR